MGSNRHRAWKLAIATAVVVITAAVLIPVVAVAGGPKEATNSATAGVNGGTTSDINISIKNTSSSGNITAQAFRVYLPTASATTSALDTSQILGVSNSTPSLGGTIAQTATYIEVQSTNITRNKTFILTISTKIACSDKNDVYSWLIDVRQSNDFNGTNNQLPNASSTNPTTTVTTGCSMSFTVPPADAAAGATITDTDYDPSATSVTVDVLGGGGAPAKWFAGTVTLTGSPTSNASPTPTLSGDSATVTFDPTTGVSTSATFPSLSIAENGTFTLRATTTETGVTSPSTASGAFTIGGYNCQSDGLDCTSGVITGSAGNSAEVTVEDGTGDPNTEITGVLRAQLTSDTLDCAGFDYEYGDTLVFSITSTSDLAGYSKTANMTKPTQYGTDPENLWKYQTCFEANYPFASMVYYSSAQANYESMLNILSGGPMPTATETSTGSGVFRGLLPTCQLLESTGVDPSLIGKMDPSGDTGYPCVVSRTVNGTGTAITTVVSVPAADPSMK